MEGSEEDSGSEIAVLHERCASGLMRSERAEAAVGMMMLPVT
jgi:hypothetical protein